MITLRLDKQLEQNISRVAEQMGVSKSELIRQSVTEFINNREHPTAWALGCDVFGKHSSGKGNLAEDRKTLINEIIKAKK